MREEEGLLAIGDIVDRILAGVSAGRVPDVARLVGDWDAVAGRPWVGVSRPVGLVDGRLAVEADTHAVASLLRFETAALVERITNALGPQVVTTVTIRVRSGAASGRS